MHTQRRNWRQFSLRSLLLASVGVSLFFGGYRLGYRRGHTDWLNAFDELIEMLSSKIGSSGTIESLPTERSNPMDDPATEYAK